MHLVQSTAQSLALKQIPSSGVQSIQFRRSSRRNTRHNPVRKKRKMVEKKVSIQRGQKMASTQYPDLSGSSSLTGKGFGLHFANDPTVNADEIRPLTSVFSSRNYGTIRPNSRLFSPVRCAPSLLTCASSWPA